MNNADIQYLDFHFQGCLPLVLMFDVKEELEMDQGKIVVVTMFTHFKRTFLMNICFL